MRGIACLLLLLLALPGWGCQMQEPLPIPEEQLVPLLADIHLAEAVIREQPDPYLRDSMADQYYDYIFQLHQLDESDFLTSIEMLKEDLARMEQVYKKVLEELSVREAAMQ